MTTDNVTPTTDAPEGTPRRRRPKRPKDVDTFDMPSRLRLVQALHGVCAAAENVAFDSNADEDTRQRLAVAAAILAQMLDEHLTNTHAL